MLTSSDFDDFPPTTLNCSLACTTKKGVHIVLRYMFELPC